MIICVRGETTTTSKGGEALSLYGEYNPDSVLAWCLPTERRRLDDVVTRLKDEKKHKGTVVLDLSQEPEKRYRGVREGEAFFTLLSNHGLLLRADRHAAGMANASALAGPPYSMLFCADLYSMMGFPVTEEQANVFYTLLFSESSFFFHLYLFPVFCHTNAVEPKLWKRRPLQLGASLAFVVGVVSDQKAEAPRR